jgi:hypothetical protein
MKRREREILIASVSWTDKSLTVNEEKAFQAGARWADKTMIDKACEILENVTVTYNKRFFGKCEENAFDADFIKEFRKAMEE